MNDRLLGLVVDGRGVVTRHGALQVVAVSALDHAVAEGQLVRVLPSTYALADLAEDSETLRRAGLAYGGTEAALSHLSALRAWGLPVPSEHPEHVCVPPDCRPRSSDKVIYHRSHALVGSLPGRIFERGGLRTVGVERAVVESWPNLALDDRRAPVIISVQRRMTTPSRLRTTLDRLPKLAGRRELRRLLDLLEAGCHSPLEIWGYLRVFADPQLPPSTTIPRGFARRSGRSSRYDVGSCASRSGTRRRSKEDPHHDTPYENPWIFL